MRPKLLEIEGLQSFTDIQKIDFEALGETGLFGIFGPTGSGKSTILDAITFALYGKVKRADGGTQGIINSKLNIAKVSYSFDLFRDGKRRTYRVERTYQRKKNSQNACEPKVARLIEVTEAGEIPLCDKAMEVSYYIKDLLGLSNEDFTRAVVLPQNSFQEFLLLNNSERRGMLERIFYLEEYGKQLLDKLGRKMAKLKSRLDVLSGELLGYADASDEALEEAKKAMDAAAVERIRVEKELKLLEVKFNEAKEVWSLVRELEDFNKKEEQHTASKDAIAEKRLKLEKALRADGLLEMIRKNKELNKKLKETEDLLGEVMAVLPGVIAGLNETKTKYESVKNEAVIEQPKLVGQRTRLVDALGIKGEIAAISTKISELGNSITQMKNVIAEKNELIKSETVEFDILGKNHDRFKQEMEPLKIDPEYRQHVHEGLKLENEVATLNGNVKELEAREATLKSSAVGMEQRLNRIKVDIEGSQKALEDLAAERQKHEESKPGDKNTVLKSMERIHSVQGLYDVLKLRKNELEQLKSRIELQKVNLYNNVQKAQILEKVKDCAGEIYEQCRVELDKAVFEMDRNAAFILSKNLKEGEPCPVCGSKQHPIPAVHTEGSDLSVLEHRVEASRKKLADAEKAFKAAERESLVAGEQVKTITEQSSQTVHDLEQKTGEYETEKQRLPEKLRTLELEQVCQEVEKANTAYNEKLEAIEAWEVKQGEYKESLQKLNDTMAGHRLIENGVVTELKVNRESVEQLEKTLTGARKLLVEAQQSYSAFLLKYGIAGASIELKKLSENDHKMHLLQKEIEQNQETAGNMRILLDKLKDELRLLNADHIKLEADTNSLDKQRNDWEIKLKELAGEANIEDEIKRIDDKLNGYVKLEGECQKSLQLLEKQHNELLTQRSLLENQQSIYTEGLKNDEAHLQTVLVERGFADGGEVESSILPTESQKVLKAEIEEYDQALTNILAQKGMLQKKLKSRNISQKEWNLTNSAYTELMVYKEECVSRSEVAKSSFDGLNKKHDKWVEVGKSYKEQNHKQGLFEQIQKILRAEHRKDNSFIDYIAEERLRYVAAKASEMLGVMTKYRYALELDVEAGFIIRDNANGGVHRMVTSLSGGETFLTSLSLALALSEQIQLKGQSPLEFFFLDEGFGTLDNELLDTVIDALERLSNKERVIGLISHVPELRSRISRRLIVQPPTLQGDGSRVTIERA